MRLWYVVHTQPQGEARAKANLERQGYEVYLPRCRKWRRHARRADIVAAPLFPRYLFLRLDISCERWRPVLRSDCLAARSRLRRLEPVRIGKPTEAAASFRRFLGL